MHFALACEWVAGPCLAELLSMHWVPVFMVTLFTGVKEIDYQTLLLNLS